jgi:flagellar basal-body rod modification protein FlgD
MAGITPATAANSSPNSAFTADAINDLDLGTFLKLMITELQNQDPLNPLDNKDMLAQLSQIREVGATDKLTKTLDSVLLGQNISSATNLIGADISAISDDGQSVVGFVNRVSIDKGVPKLHVDNETTAEASSAEGEIDAGKYSYRVVWQDEAGKLFGVEFSGDKAVTTTGVEGVDRAIELRNLPITSGPKEVYRTDATGTEPYQLVGTIVNGKQGTFIDRLADADRSGTRLTQSFQRSAVATRSYLVSLNNVSAIRPPGLAGMVDE